MSENSGQIGAADAQIRPDDAPIAPQQAPTRAQLAARRQFRRAVKRARNPLYIPLPWLLLTFLIVLLR